MAGVVVWFTGRPSAGKSTLARRVAERLRDTGAAVALLDGDEVRAALSPAPGYDDEARDAFYATLAALAALLSRQGLLVLVPATAHLRAYRERARALCERYLEVYVDVSAEEARARDSKGLYARAAAGEIRQLPSADSAYEPPLAAELRVTSGKDASAVEAVVELIDACAHKLR